MNFDTGTDTVLAEVEGGVGVVTLNRPDRRNALHPAMYDAVPTVLEAFIEDPEVGCILITGAGPAFCAGGDVRDGARRPDDDAQKAAPPSITDAAAGLAHRARMVVLLHACPKVTIAALPGSAVGAGLAIALATDLRIAARSAKLIPGWGRLAFSGDFGGPWFLSRLLGPSRALEILLDNTALDAETALDLGLVNRVTDDADLPTAAREWARTIAAGPRTTHRLVKENVRQAQRLTLAEALPLESERMVRSSLTDDHKAAVRAWLADAAAKTSATDSIPDPGR